MKLTTNANGRTGIRLDDGRILAVPPMHPALPSKDRVAIFTAVLRRQYDQAVSLAEEFNTRAAAAFGMDPEARKRDALLNPEEAEDIIAPNGTPVPMERIATPRGIVEVPLAAVPRWGMRFPLGVALPEVLVHWDELAPSLAPVVALPVRNVTTDQIGHRVQQGGDRGVQLRGEFPAGKAV